MVLTPLPSPWMLSKVSLRWLCDGIPYLFPRIATLQHLYCQENLKIVLIKFKCYHLVLVDVDHDQIYSQSHYFGALRALSSGQGRVAEVARAREQRSPKGQGLLRKEGASTYAILSRNLLLSQFTRFLKGFQ